MAIRFFLTFLLAAAWLPSADIAGARPWRPTPMEAQFSQECRDVDHHGPAPAQFASGCGARVTPVARRERQWGGPWIGFRRFFEPRPKRRARIERPSRKRSLGRSSRPSARSQARRTERNQREGGRSSVGTIRTLCVRTCDGYYFPISFSTTRKHLAADQAACQRACPGAESLIYHHRSSGEGPEQMISMSGSPYTELPFAFSYRTALNPSCSCSHPGGSLLNVAIAGPAPLHTATDARLPQSRPAPGEDPETLANRDGDFVPRFLARPLAGKRDDVRNGIRIVETDDPHPVPVSPVPNDFETSLLWSHRE